LSGKEIRKSLLIRISDTATSPERMAAVLHSGMEKLKILT
jgi:hypothetical protein